MAKGNYNLTTVGDYGKLLGDYKKTRLARKL